MNRTAFIMCLDLKKKKFWAGGSFRKKKYFVYIKNIFEREVTKKGCWDNVLNLKSM